MECQRSKRRRAAWVWQEFYDRLIPVLKFTILARRILVSGLIVTAVGIGTGHFILLPDLPLGYAFLSFAAAEIGVEIFWKYYCAYCLGRARERWMKTRSILVKACNDIFSNTDELQAMVEGKTGSWAKIQVALDSVNCNAKALLSGVKDVDEAFSTAENTIGSGPFLAIATSKTLVRIPKIWELFGAILPPKVRRDAFDPAFNDMLEDYVRAGQFLGNRDRRWLASGFTMWAAFIVLDSLGVTLTSSLLGSIREWFRRQ